MRGGFSKTVSLRAIGSGSVAITALRAQSGYGEDRGVEPVFAARADDAADCHDLTGRLESYRYETSSPSRRPKARSDPWAP